MEQPEPSAELSLPELIIHAVTESAAVIDCHTDGGVVWHADALLRLARALGQRCYLASGNPIVREGVLDIIIDGSAKCLDYETQIIPKIILYVLLQGTGIRQGNESLEPMTGEPPS